MPRYTAWHFFIWVFVALTSVLMIFSFPFNKEFASLTALSLLRKISL